MMGIALAENLFTLFLFYETLTFSTWPLVTHNRTRDAVRAGRIYLGVLLITSLMIIPAASARRFSRTPEQMALIATLIGALAVAGGLLALALQCRVGGGKRYQCG